MVLSVVAENVAHVLGYNKKQFVVKWSRWFCLNTVSLRGELIVFFFTTLCFRNETTMNSEIKGHQK